MSLIALWAAVSKPQVWHLPYLNMSVQFLHELAILVSQVLIMNSLSNLENRLKMCVVEKLNSQLLSLLHPEE